MEFGKQGTDKLCNLWHNAKIQFGDFISAELKQWCQILPFSLKPDFQHSQACTRSIFYILTTKKERFGFSSISRQDEEFARHLETYKSRLFGSVQMYSEGPGVEWLFHFVCSIALYVHMLCVMLPGLPCKRHLFILLKQ